VLSPQDFTPYSTAVPLTGGSAPTWLRDELEAQRVMSYSLYEQIYWNVPESFKLVQRGTDDQPIYVPAGRVIVETIQRYLAKGLRVDPDPLFGTSQEQTFAQQVFTDFARRTRFYSAFSSNKRYGVIRGDWAFALTGDPLKPEGSRVGLEQIDPGGLFPIWGGTNLDDIIGWHLVEQYTDQRGDPRLLRRTWRKATGLPGPSAITYEVGVFEMDEWGGPGMAVEDEKPIGGEPVILPETTLPAPIDELPIFTIANFEQPGYLWGSSEMRGLERLMAAIDQGISDEELELVLNGLGVYASNAGEPVDEAGQPVGWNLGPARVVEVPPDAFFNRVSGVTSVEPFQAHLKYLGERLDEAVGQSDVAKGKVDVQVAESGVALLLQMGPILSRVEEKELIITDVMSQLLFNLPKWLVAYEGSFFSPMVSEGMGEDATGTRLIPRYGPKLPENADKRIDALLKLLAAKAVGLNFVWKELRRLGWELPDDVTMLAEIQQTAELTAAADPMAQRMEEELVAASGSNGDAG
jgi:hypothetical protein